MTNLNSMEHYMPCVHCRCKAEMKIDANGKGYTEKHSYCDTCEVKMLFNKLKHYEDLEEQGRLIELPCAVGDTVYLFSYDIIHPFTINGFEINKYEVEFKGSYCGEDKNLEHWEIRLPVSKICKTVFLTPEEAEAKLNELRGEQ